MKDVLVGIGGAVIGVLAAVGIFMGAGSDFSQTPAPTPTPFITGVPSPDELSCPSGFVEVQRAVVHVDNGVDTGYVSCDIPGRYNFTITPAGGGVLRDWNGNEITDPAEKARILGGN